MVRVITEVAPRVSRSLRTATSQSARRATRKKRESGEMRSRQTAIANAELAPRTRMRGGRVLDNRRDPLPDGGSDLMVDIASELPPIWIERLDLLGCHHCVFRGFHRATVI